MLFFSHHFVGKSLTKSSMKYETAALRLDKPTSKKSNLESHEVHQGTLELLHFDVVYPRFETDWI